ncbi:hypothetical protein TYRP_004019 [Tyrophagus putrescentiae]|nr:hypothetical protein TYRP_004019 [Tyrophagus putrescentiae]
MDPSLITEIEDFQRYLDEHEAAFREAAIFTPPQLEALRQLEQTDDALSAMSRKLDGMLADLDASVLHQPKTRLSVTATKNKNKNSNNSSEVKVSGDLAEHIAAMKGLQKKLS